MSTRDERKDRGNGDERSRDTRYRASVRHFEGYCNSGVKKTEKFEKRVNEDYLKNKAKSTTIDIEIRPIAVEMDEMWSYYHDKSHQVWLWWAVDHKTNVPLAYTFGTREHRYLDELLSLLAPFPIGVVYADNNCGMVEKAV